MFNRKDLLGTSDLSEEELNSILDRAWDMERIVDSGHKKSDCLKGKSVMLAFYENSTRTHSSFDHAVKILGGNSVNLSVGSSSVKKGEVLLDTAQTLEALGADVIVMRHSMSGAQRFLAERLSCGIVNAGDGLNEHPTQCLLDLFTMQHKFGKNLAGLNVFICGDIKHSRVARSDIWALHTLGASVTVCAPPTLMPYGIESYPVRVVRDMEDGIRGADVVMLLRLQLERQSAGIISSLDEYTRYYQLNARRLALASPDAIVMHPGPINRGAEIASEVADCAQAVILQQVHSGLCVRMAVLDMIANRTRN